MIGPCPPFADRFRIGRVEMPNRVVLAPMAGLTSSAYRRHLKMHGAGLVVTEMVSAYGLIYHNVRTAEYLDFAEEERPIAVQLFGDTPEALARAAEIVLSQSRIPDMLDVNMGCPVRKVMKTGAGAALLGEPERAAAVAAAVVRAADQVDIPVTVKLRTGLRPGHNVAGALAGRLEQVGVKGLAVHPRAASDYYHGHADHRITAAVVQAVTIPVMASGDVTSAAAAASIREQTGATAVMAARAVAGNPWLIEAILAGVDAPRPPLPVVVCDLRLLLVAAAEERGEQGAAQWIRKLVGWYLKPAGVPPEVIEELRSLADATGLDAALQALVA